MANPSMYYEVRPLEPVPDLHIGQQTWGSESYNIPIGYIQNRKPRWQMINQVYTDPAALDRFGIDPNHPAAGVIMSANSYGYPLDGFTTGYMSKLPPSVIPEEMAKQIPRSGLQPAVVGAEGGVDISGPSPDPNASDPSDPNPNAADAVAQVNKYVRLGNEIGAGNLAPPPPPPTTKKKTPEQLQEEADKSRRKSNASSVADEINGAPEGDRKPSSYKKRRLERSERDLRASGVPAPNPLQMNPMFGTPQSIERGATPMTTGPSIFIGPNFNTPRQNPSFGTTTPTNSSPLSGYTFEPDLTRIPKAPPQPGDNRKTGGGAIRGTSKMKKA